MGGGVSREEVTVCKALLREATVCSEAVDTLLQGQTDGTARCHDGCRSTTIPVEEGLRDPPTPCATCMELTEHSRHSRYGNIVLPMQKDTEEGTTMTYCIATTQDLERVYHSLQAAPRMHPSDDVVRLERIAAFKAAVASAVRPVVECIVRELHLPEDQQTFLDVRGSSAMDIESFYAELVRGGLWSGSEHTATTATSSCHARFYQRKASEPNPYPPFFPHSSAMQELPMPQSCAVGVLRGADLCAVEEALTGQTAAGLGGEGEGEKGRGGSGSARRVLCSALGVGGDGVPGFPPQPCAASLANRVLKVTLLFGDAEARQARLREVSDAALLANQVFCNEFVQNGDPTAFLAVPLRVVFEVNGVVAVVETVFDVCPSVRTSVVYALQGEGEVAKRRVLCADWLVDALLRRTLAKLGLAPVATASGMWCGPASLEVKCVTEDGRLYLHTVEGLFASETTSVHPQALCTLPAPMPCTEAGLREARLHILTCIVPHVAAVLFNEHTDVSHLSSTHTAALSPFYTTEEAGGVHLSVGVCDGIVSMCAQYGLVLSASPLDDSFVYLQAFLEEVKISLMEGVVAAPARQRQVEDEAAHNHFYAGGGRGVGVGVGVGGDVRYYSKGAAGHALVETFSDEVIAVFVARENETNHVTQSKMAKLRQIDSAMSLASPRDADRGEGEKGRDEEEGEEEGAGEGAGDDADSPLALAQKKVVVLQSVLACIMSAHRLQAHLQLSLRREVTTFVDTSQAYQRAQARSACPDSAMEANCQQARAVQHFRETSLRACVGVADVLRGCVDKLQRFSHDLVGACERRPTAVNVQQTLRSAEQALLSGAILLVHNPRMDMTPHMNRFCTSPPTPPEDVELREKLSLDDVRDMQRDLLATNPHLTAESLARSGATSTFVTPAEWRCYFPTPPCALQFEVKQLFFQYFLHISGVLAACTEPVVLSDTHISMKVEKAPYTQLRLLATVVRVDATCLMFCAEVYNRRVFSADRSLKQKRRSLQPDQQGGWCDRGQRAPFFFEDLCTFKLCLPHLFHEDDDVTTPSTTLDTRASQPSEERAFLPLHDEEKAVLCENVVADYIAMCAARGADTSWTQRIPAARLLLARFASFHEGTPFLPHPNRSGARECAPLLQSCAEACRGDVLADHIERTTLAGWHAAQQDSTPSTAAAACLLADLAHDHGHGHSSACTHHAQRNAAERSSLLQLRSRNTTRKASLLGISGTRRESEAVQCFTAAVQTLQSALHVVCGAHGYTSLHLVPPLAALCTLYEVNGQPDSAEGLRAYLLALRLRHNTPASVEVSTSLNNLACNLYEQHRFVAAEPLFVHDLALVTTVFGPDHESTATTLNNLASLYAERGMHEKCVPLYLRDLQITTDALGAHHPHTATSLNNLARVYALQRDIPKARDCYTQALHIREAACGPDSAEVAEVCTNLGSLCMASHDTDAALSWCLRSVHILEECGDVARYGLALNALHMLLDEEGRTEEAEEVAQKMYDLKLHATSLHASIHP